MNPRSPSLTRQAHALIADHLQPGDMAIDATAGNGYDTAFLAGQVGASGQVFAFDIQAGAIEATQARLDKAGLLDKVTLFQASHSQLASHIPVRAHGRVAAAMFNLGYLPGSDKTVITRGESTVAALGQLLGLLRAGGAVSILSYRGHPGGRAEHDAVGDYLENEPRWKMLDRLTSSGDDGPVLWIIRSGSL